MNLSGYESFSVRKSQSISGQIIPNNYDKVTFNYHAQLFSDPIFFEQYIIELERISNESYFNAFIEKIQNELNEKIGILSKEWAHRKFELDVYFENIKLIRNNLNLPKPCHVFLQSHNKDSVVLSMAPVSDFPIEIISIKNNGKKNELNERFILPAKPRSTVAAYFELVVNGNFKKIKKMEVYAKILGSSKIFKIEVAKYPSYMLDNEPSEEIIKDIVFDTTIVSVNNNVIKI